MSRLGTLLVAAALVAGCDSGSDETASFRVEITGGVEAAFSGRPSVVRIPEEDGGGYVLTLGQGFSSVTLSLLDPVEPGTASASGAFVLLASGGAVRAFSADGGTVTTESVDGSIVRVQFAFEATDGEDRVEVEGVVTADLDAAVDLPVVPRPSGLPRR